MLIAIREKTRRLEEDVSRKIFMQLVETLYYMERENIVHRDIKLENIIINPDTLHIKVIDFGFGQVFQQMLFPKKMDLVCGTLEYMAPEILFKDGRM